MVETIKGANEKFCERAHCNTLQNAGRRKFITTFLILLVLAVVRIVVLGIIFGYGFLPVYYLYFPLMAVLQITLLVAEAVILFRRTGLFVLTMLLHLLIFIPEVSFLTFVPWGLVGLLLYGLVYGT